MKNIDKYLRIFRTQPTPKNVDKKISSLQALIAEEESIFRAKMIKYYGSLGDFFMMKHDYQQAANMYAVALSYSPDDDALKEIVEDTQKLIG